WIVALREYTAAVKTKTFLITLVLMPVLMGGSLLVQLLVEGIRDTKDKHFAIIDRTGGELFDAIDKQVDQYNEAAQVNGKRTKQRSVLEKVEPRQDRYKQGYELSQRVRNGELLGFLDIGADVLKAPAETPAGDARSDTKRNQATEARFYSNRPITNAFPPL